MGKIYKNYTDLFKDMNKAIEKSLEDISNSIVEKWKDMVTERFYEAYYPSTYDRSMFPFETRDSISILSIEKVGNRYDIEIGYDASKIHTYKNMSWTAHEDPNNMGNLFEYGSILGHDPRGIRAVDDLRKFVSSAKFKNEFKQEMEKFGFYIK